MKKTVLLVAMILGSMFMGCSVQENTIVRKYEYEGHEYLVFTYKSVSGVTFVHDPECDNEECRINK